MTSTNLSRLKRFFIGVLALFVIAAMALLALAWTPMGSAPNDATKTTFPASTHWDGKLFNNPQPMWQESFSKSLRDAFRENIDSNPHEPINIVQTSPAPLKTPSDLRVTWFGHSSVLLDLDQTTVLIDPVWSDRVSPFQFMGPKRWYDPPLKFNDIPNVDVVVISHDHYDHLDQGTIARMRTWTNLFVVPLGVGSHLKSWGISPDRIIELDWWQSTKVKSLTINAVPARHHSGRINPQADHTLWSGYAFVGPSHRVFYSGDTGMHDSFPEIGSKFDPFDLALVEVGQYSQAWPDWHIGPEQAIVAAKQVGARTMMPIHWALFKLADHTWTEPGVRSVAASTCQNYPLILPPPGMTVDLVNSTYAFAKWWPDLPTRTAEQYPLVPTRDGNKANLYPVPVCAAHEAKG